MTLPNEKGESEKEKKEKKMAPVYHKPENALKRAEGIPIYLYLIYLELIAVNQSQTALTLLLEMISSRRNRSAPLSILEPIMIKFVQLCVQLQKGKILKEGLHAYKNITQNTSVLTLEVCDFSSLYLNSYNL